MKKKSLLWGVSICAIVASGLVMGFSSNAKADAATDNEIQQLKADFAASQAQQAALNQQMIMMNKKIEQLSSENTWKTVGHGPDPKFVSKDGGSSFEVHGQIQSDSAYGTVPGQKGSSGSTIFRRAEIQADGTYNNNIIYKFEYDVSKSSSTGALTNGIVDMYAGYQINIGDIYSVALAGNQHVPFLQTPSSGDTLFLEGGLPNIAFGPPRQIGITEEANTHYWNTWFGVFGQTPKNSNSNVAQTGNSAFAAAFDQSYTPINSKGKILNFQAGVSYNKYKDNNSTADEVSFGASPDTNAYGSGFVATPKLSVKSSLAYAAAFDVQYGRLAGHGEIYLTDTENSANHVYGGNTIAPSFTGYEAEADYFLTDDYKPWDDTCSCFVKVQVKHPITDGGIGAWQVAARIDQVNLNDHKFNVQGGNETNLTLALNWYPTTYTRVMLNYIRVLPVEGATANNTSSSKTIRQNANIVAVRLQIKY